MSKMILCPYCGSESVTEEYFGEYQTGCPNCGANGPYADSIEAAVSAWKSMPRMSAIIAWQFQAGCAELRLQRLIDAAQTMREAQTTFENMAPADNYDVIPPGLRQAACAMGDAEDALEGMLAVLLADASAPIGGHHD